MIIAFYPGAGGNRYLQRLLGNDWTQPNTSYDLKITQLYAHRYLLDPVPQTESQYILTHCMNSQKIQQTFPGHAMVFIKSNLQISLQREWALHGHQRFQDRKIKNTVSRLEHYMAFRAPAWPDIVSEDQIDQLPENIKQEVHADYDKVVNDTVVPVPSVLSQLTRNTVDKINSAYEIIQWHLDYYNKYPVDFSGAEQVIDIDADGNEFCQLMQTELSRYHNEIFDQVWSTIDEQQSHDVALLPGNKSVFMSSAEKMKDQLGHALCLAKWKQVSLHLPTGLNNSCYHPPLHLIDPDAIKINPAALHNTWHKKHQRQIMLQGQRPTECSYCWNMEDQGKLSDRHYRSSEPWAAVDFETIKSSTGAEDDIIPSYVEVNFNNACNLKCSYCSPQFSSSWGDEVARNGGYPTSTIHNDPAHFMASRRPIPVREHNPYVEAFWSWWPTLYPELKHFRMTGGEPLMDRNTYRVFDYVLENPKPDLHLNVTSNFSVEDQLFEKYMSYVKRLCNANIEHFMQYVSLDGWGTQAEYIRHGMAFDLVWSRVDQYLTQVPSYNSLTFIITMNNLSVSSLRQLLEGILELRGKHSRTYQRVWFDTPVLREPAWQSLQILPESYVQRLEGVRDWMSQNLTTPADPYNGFKDYEVARLDRDIAWMRSAQDKDHSQDQADFYRFFLEHDRRRGTDFLQTFPEMRAWWTWCEGRSRK